MSSTWRIRLAATGIATAAFSLTVIILDPRGNGTPAWMLVLAGAALLGNVAHLGAAMRARRIERGLRALEQQLVAALPSLQQVHIQIRAALSVQAATVAAVAAQLAPLTRVEPVEPIGGTTGPLVGWRSWDLRDDGTLEPIFGRAPWEPGDNEAVCRSANVALLQSLGIDPERHDETPSADCTCGFYAHSRPHRPLDIRGGRGRLVAGLMLGWGRSLIHEAGFRTEYARVLALIVDGPVVGPVLRAATRYGVPIVSSKRAEQMAKEWSA